MAADIQDAAEIPPSSREQAHEAALSASVEAPLSAPAPKRGRASRAAKPASRARAKRVRLTPVHAAAALLVAAVASGVGFRTSIVRLLPQTARLYAAIGMPVNLRGLEFAGLRSELLIDKDQAVLLVEGEIMGVAPTAEVPKVTVSLRGPEGREIYAWTSEAARTTLAKGESTTFKARLASPPADGREVVVRFAEAETRTSAH